MEWEPTRSLDVFHQVLCYWPLIESIWALIGYGFVGVSQFAEVDGAVLLQNVPLRVTEHFTERGEGREKIIQQPIVEKYLVKTLNQLAATDVTCRMAVSYLEIVTEGLWNPHIIPEPRL